MTAIAQILKKFGHHVSGSDTKETFFTDKVLQKEKIKFFNGFDSKNIPANLDLVIYSSAYNYKNNTELAEIKKRKIPAMVQAEALASIFNRYEKSIAVCGSHGKTTTSAMLGYVLEKSGADPTVEVGSKVPQFNGNAIVGAGDIMVIEADEYQNKLKYYNPQIVLINNIDYDHPDYFKSKKAYRKVFSNFLQRVPPDGFIVANFDDDEIAQAVKGALAKVIDYGYTTVNDYRIRDEVIKKDKQYFSLYQNLKLIDEFCLRLIGHHNVMNATAVIACCLELKIPVKTIKAALAEFKGTARRMEFLGKDNGARFFDDYAHHPTEIKKTLQSTKLRYPEKNLVCVFMPHTFTRTKALFADFTQSFKNADKLIVLPIYGSAREQQGGVSSEDLVKKIGKKASYIPTMEKCARYLKKNTTKNDVVILMGAGDTFRVWDELKK